MKNNDGMKDLNASQAKVDDKYTNKILDTALKLFKEHGIDQVNMHQIAKNARIGQGTLYRRYSHKGALCSDIISRNADQFLSELEDLYQENEGNKNIPDQIEMLMAKLLDFIDESAHLLVTINSYHSGTTRFTHYQHPVFQRLHMIIRNILEKSVYIHDNVTQTQITIIANMMVAALSPELYLYQKGQGISKQDIMIGFQHTFIKSLENL